MGKKKRILFNPKFAHLKRMRKWQTLVEANSDTEPTIEEPLVEEETVVETPILKLAEKELAPKAVEKEEEKPSLKAAKVTKKSVPHRTKVVTKKKTTAKARVKKTTSKK